MRLLIELRPQEPRRGLAVDEALLESVHRTGLGVVRLWVNDRAVIVGRSQSVEDEVDVEFAAKRGIPILRRISGGGAVYHYRGNLNVSVALGDGRRTGSVDETFQWFGTAIARALGVVCPALFAVGNDLLVETAKVGGAAQARRGDALLYHTTLLIGTADIAMERLLRAMGPNYDPRWVASRPRRTVSLSETVGRRLRVASVAGLLRPALAGAVGASLRVGRLEMNEERRAERLATTKYGDPAWNRCR